MVNVAKHHGKPGERGFHHGLFSVTMVRCAGEDTMVGEPNHGVCVRHHGMWVSNHGVCRVAKVPWFWFRYVARHGFLFLHHGGLLHTMGLPGRENKPWCVGLCNLLTMVCRNSTMVCPT